MNLSEIWIRRPIMTTLVMLGILLFGLISYRDLPINNLPDVEFPTVQVTASLPGASPETMAATVATPLEKQFSSIAGIQSMISTSMLGGTLVTLQFSLDRSIDAAALDVNSAIAAAMGVLPRNMPTPPTYQKVNPADMPILFITLYSDTLPMTQVNDYAENVVIPNFATINGVGLADVVPRQKYAVHVQVDPSALAAGARRAHPEAARVQHGAGGRSRQGRAAAPGSGHAERDEDGRHLRPVAVHPRVDLRRAVHDGPHDLPGHRRHLPFRAGAAADAHSQHHGAALAHRHLHRHEPLPLLAQQSLHDGPHARHRLRRGRRRGGTREHHPEDGRRRDGAGGVDEADAFLLVGLGEVYETPLANTGTVLDIVKWGQIYDRLEEALDRIEDVANVIEGMVLKNV